MLERTEPASPSAGDKVLPSPMAIEERVRHVRDPAFGRVFTDHMVTVLWSKEQGWGAPELRRYGSLDLDPSSIALHYAQSVFDGLKVYRQRSGALAAFRPVAHAARLRSSARRLALPALPETVFMEALHMLVLEDRGAVPAASEHSLYLRPLLLATEPGLGVRPAAEALFVLIASPVGAYFPRGVTSLTVWVCEDYARAGPGGTGGAKCGGNYAAGLAGRLQAAEHDCDEVVWLDAVERQWVEELGGMNIFFVEDTGASVRLVTPPLGDTILPGVVRDSLLTLAPELGYEVDERPVSLAQWQRGSTEGSIREVFACGTAAVITPIGWVRSADAEWTIGLGRPGPTTTQLRQALLEIQYGDRPDTHGWMTEISA
jgi:branched-chain amino acid aminotransferase